MRGTWLTAAKELSFGHARGIDGLRPMEMLPLKLGPKSEGALRGRGTGHDFKVLALVRHMATQDLRLPRTRSLSA